MMLALADHSDDNGNSYPSVPTLAKKCRMKPRNANLILAALRDSGELQIKLNAGIKGTNRYRIVLTALGGMQDSTGVALYSCSPLQGAEECKVQPATATPVADCLKPLQPATDETSLNRQEPSDIAAATAKKVKTKTPECPHRALIDLFAERLPELPKPFPELWAGKAAAAMQERWRWVLTASREDGRRWATTPDEALKFFRKFFDHVAESDFLTGRNGKWMRCSLRWLMNRENFAKVMDGEYGNDPDSTPSAMAGAI